MSRRSSLVLALLSGFAAAYLLLRQGDSVPANTVETVNPVSEKLPAGLPQSALRPSVKPGMVATPAPAVDSAEPDKTDSGFEVWLGRLAAAATPQAHAQILQEAAAHEPHARFLELIARQLRSGKPDDRLAALQALKEQSGERVTDLFKLALNDGETGIREIARHYALQRDESLRLAVLDHGLSSPHEDVRIRCFDALRQETSKQVIPSLIHALASNNPAMADEAARLLAARLGPAAPVFKKSADAESWWEQNANRYGDDMRRLD